EIYLSYAEAANEAWGPTGTGTHSFSAYDVIKAIRRRAGVGASNNDPYLEECKVDKEKMRELIRNERRLELCFESFRFWDLRRLTLVLSEFTPGLVADRTISTPMLVSMRSYRNHMYYGTIAFSEMIQHNNLVRNASWE